MNAIKTNIQNSIQAYLSDENVHYAILITGQWGCGKTYFITDLMKSWKVDSAEKSNSIRFKPLYISLNGISTVSGLYHTIWKQIYPILTSRTSKVLKLVFGGAIKAVSKCFIDLNGDGQADDISSSIDVESFIKLFIENKKVVGNRILVFDDLERCLIPTTQLFGILNQFTEHSNCKVILVANEKKLETKDGEDSQYNQIKEKLVGQTFKVDVDVSDSVESIIATTNNGHIVSAKNLVLDIFNASKLQNLRSLKIALQSFGVFSVLIGDKYKKNNDTYQEFLKNVLAYFLICSFELFSGNNEIKEYQGFKHVSDKQNEMAKKDKYSECLSKHGVYSSHYSIPISSIYQFLTEGYIENLEDILSKNMFFKNASQKDWEHLWLYSNLENEDLLRYVSCVKDNISQRRIDNIPTLLHSAGVIFRLNNSRIIRINKKRILQDCQKTVDNIIGNASSPFDSTLYFSVESSFGKAYSGNGLPEFKKLTEYCAKQLERFQLIFQDQTCKRIWEKLTDNNIDEISKLIHRRHELFGRDRVEANIFSGVNLRLVAKRICSLSNMAKVQLSDEFFVYQERIYSSEEANSMKELVELLRKKATSFKLVDKENILMIASQIEKCYSPDELVTK